MNRYCDTRMIGCKDMGHIDYEDVWTKSVTRFTGNWGQGSFINL